MQSEKIVRIVPHFIPNFEDATISSVHLEEHPLTKTVEVTEQFRFDLRTANMIIANLTHARNKLKAHLDAGAGKVVPIRSADDGDAPG